ncbi:MAG: ArgE/DapE family deacylase [Thaumarchaeota archaeon]|nr:ArgE/DapE family deacylase [Nitrososphaerota archaeon]
MADPIRLSEVEIEGHEKFRDWRRSDYSESLEEGRARLRRVERYIPGILAEVDRLEEYAVSLLREVIGAESVNSSPGGERPVAEIVARELRGQGYQVQMVEPEPNRTSLVASRTFGGAQHPEVLFYGHMDTVPAGNLSEWRYPPFEGRVVEGKVFGRGAQDCKTGVSSAVVAARVLAQSGLKLSGTVSVATVADEEAGGHKGVHQLIERGLLHGDYAVYIESVPEEVHIAHNGMVWLKVTVRGESAHSSKKATATNAILEMGKVAAALDRMEFTDWKPHALVPGGPYISVNKIVGGNKENMIPDECSITCDIRTMPGQTLSSVLADVGKILGDLRQKDPKLIVSHEVLTYGRSGEIPPSDPAVVFTQLAAERVIGITPKAVGVRALTDQRWALYDAGIPMVIYSCGTPTWHVPNEYITIKGYLDTVKILCVAALMHLAGEE